MTTKLTEHVKVLVGEMASGTVAADALKDANNGFPPRTFDHGDPPKPGDTCGINQMRLLYMKKAGDGNATLHTVYKTGYISTSCVLYGDALTPGGPSVDWGIVFRDTMPALTN